MDLKFEWNERKASLNIKKHSVSFEEAKTVFDDVLARIFEDEWNSVNEHREIIIGHSVQNRLLLVCFTERSEGLIRIFSSRPTTRKERKDYEEYTKFRSR
jgi:uncharacterized DUF497 family protein